MDRDRRLTGIWRGQTDNVEPPRGFELSSGWKVCCEFETDVSRKHAYADLDGKRILLGRDSRGWSPVSDAYASTVQPSLRMTISKICIFALLKLR